MEPDTLYVGFGADAGDLRLPSGAAPISIHAERLHGTENGTTSWNVSVSAASGAQYDITNPQNRVWVEDAGNATVVSVDGTIVTLADVESGASIRIVYQRARANATEPWADVAQFQDLSNAPTVVATEITV